MPEADGLMLICRALGVTPGYLFGLDDGTVIADVVDNVRNHVGEQASRVVEAMGRVDVRARQRIADWVDGLVVGLQQQAAPDNSKDPPPKLDD